MQYMARNKAVVHRRGKDGVRVREPAAGAAVASSLHVTARRARGDRAPAPQLHVHNLVVGVTRTDGRSWWRRTRGSGFATTPPWRAARCSAPRSPTRSCRPAGRSAPGTGDRGRYFEVQGVPEALCEVFSPRSREVAAGARARSSGSSGCGCRAARWRCWRRRPGRPRTTTSTPSGCAQVWDALGQEHDFGPGAGSRLRRHEGQIGHVEARMREARRVVLEQLREQGPTVSLARARALVFEAVDRPAVGR